MGDIRPQPMANGYVIPSVSSMNIFAAPTMDGTTFKEILLPTDAKSIKLQASNGVATDFTSFAANPPTFHFSRKEVPSAGEWTQHVGELNFDLVAPTGTVFYVRAETGVVISVTVGA